MAQTNTIEVAVPALAPAGSDLGQMILIGLFLGLAPVAAGLLAFPAIRGASEGAMGFILALTIGLLFYLLIDTVSEGLEAAETALDRLRAGTLVWVAMAASALVLLAIGRRGGQPPEGVALATFIAFGIGVHNFGEGLAVGAALQSHGDRGTRAYSQGRGILEAHLGASAARLVLPLWAEREHPAFAC